MRKVKLTSGAVADFRKHFTAVTSGRKFEKYSMDKRFTSKRCFFLNNVYGGPLAEYVVLMAALSVSVIFSIQMLGTPTGESLCTPKRELPEHINVTPEEFGKANPQADTSIDICETDFPEDPDDPETPPSTPTEDPPILVCSGFACRETGPPTTASGGPSDPFDDPEIISNCPPEGITWDYNPWRDGGTIRAPGAFFRDPGLGNPGGDGAPLDWPFTYADGTPGTYTYLFDGPGEMDTLELSSITSPPWEYWGDYLGPRPPIGSPHLWAFVRQYSGTDLDRLPERNFCPNVNYPPLTVAGSGNYPPYYDDGPLMGLNFLEGTSSFDRLNLLAPENSGFDAVIGFQSDDYIIDRSSNGNVIIPGPGNDTVSGRGGDDIYVYKLGDGRDAYRPDNTGGSGGDTIHFLDIASTDVDVQYTGGTSVTLAMPDGGEIFLEDIFNPGRSHRWLDEFIFSDTSIQSVQSIRDWVTNQLVPPHGSTASIQNMGVFQNHVHVMAEDGSYSLNGENTSAPYDEIYFQGLNQADVTLSLIDEDSLRVTLPDGDRVTMNRSDSSLMTMAFEDGALSGSQVRERALLDAVAAGGTVELTDGDDVINYAASIHPSIYIDGRSQGSDELHFTETDFSDVTLTLLDGADDLRIEAPDGDTVYLNRHMFYDPLEVISFADGSTPTRAQMATRAISDMLDAGYSNVHLSRQSNIIGYDPTSHGSVNLYTAYASDTHTFETPTPWSAVTIQQVGSVDARITFPDGDTVFIDWQLGSDGIDEFIFDGVTYTKQDFDNRAESGGG